MTRIAFRSSPNSFHGLGLEEGLRVLERVRTETMSQTGSLWVTSDFSDPAWGPATGEVCDMVQVPAYLCRQTSILARRRGDWQTSSSEKRAIYESLEHEKLMSQTGSLWL